MQAIRSILVVVDPSHPESLALKRATLIAGVTQSHLHLLVCDRKQDHSAWLADLAGTLTGDGYSVSTQQAWHENLHQTVITVQQAEGCGLVIKQHVPENPLKRALLTPDDWKLLRYCPGPVLMVKTDTPWTGGVILAAVDVGNNDGPHRTLHASIISHGYDIAGLARGSLHVVSAHPSPCSRQRTRPSSSRRASRRATAMPARNSRRSSTSVTTTCTSPKARRT